MENGACVENKGWVLHFAFVPGVRKIRRRVCALGWSWMDMRERVEFGHGACANGA